MSQTLYEQLKSGMSAEDIVAAFTADLNAAEKQVYAEALAEEEARKEEEARRAEQAKAVRAYDLKVEEFASLLERFMRFLSYYYPTLGIKDKSINSATSKSLAELILSLLELEVAKPKRRSLNTAKMLFPDVFTAIF